MRKYEVYVLKDDGDVISRVDLFCDGEKEAKEWAKALVDAKPIELWKGSTRIERIDPPRLGQPRLAGRSIGITRDDQPEVVLLRAGMQGKNAALRIPAK